MGLPDCASAGWCTRYLLNAIHGLLLRMNLPGVIATKLIQTALAVRECRYQLHRRLPTMSWFLTSSHPVCGRFGPTGALTLRR